MDRQTTFSFNEEAPKKIGIGVDFGTSNSSVAIFDGRTVKSLEIKEGDDRHTLIPTANYISRDLLPTVGHAGINRYLEDNRNRQVRLKREDLQTVDITAGFGGEGDAKTFSVKAMALTDQDLPGRLFRGIKSWLGNVGIERVEVFGKPFRLTALITPILHSLKESYAELEGDLPAVYVGRPVNFVGGSAASNEQAMMYLQEACDFAEIASPVFCEEPVAAAISFLQAHSVPVGARYLVFDFGGGTLDLTLLEKLDDGFTVLGNAGIGLGGNRIDSLIYEHKLFPELGQGVRTYNTEGDVSRGEKNAFRFHHFAEKLIDWQNTYQLNTLNLRNEIFLGINEGGATAEKLNRLRGIITGNLSYQVLRAVEAAKIALSGADETTIEVPEVGLCVPFTRAELEEMLKAPLAEISGIVASLLEDSGVTATTLTGVVCTGGSSHIPIVQQHLKSILQTPVIQHEAFTGIAAGLAIASYEEYGIS